ncbi:hypothetical protein [Methylobacterium sp. SyP6R]|uniref:hypothetical protein n=1 Tax=Methylobacterium sp. SyP6R TaxID=2718876 RepID=UPI001F48F5E7|nr:hypothetical protein [Methylobacterium sp. SyP6R]MCF4127138.1 hypothetical protein [Methylobacterium sp. SyP6R]
MSLDTASLISGAVSQQGAAFTRQVATLAVRRQLDAERAVAGLVAETAANAPAPPGQGQRLDIRV